MKKDRNFIMLKVITVILLLLIPVPTEKFFLTSGIVWGVILLDNIHSLNILYIGFLIPIMAILGIALIFIKNRLLVVTGYVFTYISLISILIKSLDVWVSTVPLAIYTIMSGIVIYLTLKKHLLEIKKA